MASVINAIGTSQNEFKLGKTGPTLFQGSSTPLNSFGSNGDLFINKETSEANFFQKINGSWKKYSLNNLQTVEVNSSSYVVKENDEYVGVNFTSGNATITLPSLQENGKKFIIKDESGDASLNNITVNTNNNEKIDKNDIIVLDQDFQTITVVFKNNNYFII